MLIFCLHVCVCLNYMFDCVCSVLIACLPVSILIACLPVCVRWAVGGAECGPAGQPGQGETEMGGSETFKHQMAAIIGDVLLSGAFMA